MSDENNIFDEEDLKETKAEEATYTYTQSQTENNTQSQQNNRNDYQYSYQQGGYQENPYQQNPYQNVGPNGKKVGVGFGIASLVLGIISLVLFCTCINIVFAILAIVFGIIQLVKYEKKGMAIAGISTAGASILLFVICIILLTSNKTFINSMEKEIYSIEDGEDSEDIQQFQKFLEKYTDGNYDVDIQGSDEDGEYKIQVSPNEDGTPNVHIDTQEHDTL